MDGLRYEEPGIVVIERPPCCHTLFISPYGCRITPYYLAFPWQVFVICHNKLTPWNVSVGFRNTPMTDEDQKLYWPNLWNIFTHDLKVCTGEFYGNIRYSSSIDELCQKVLLNFWNSVWNEEIHRDYSRHSAYTKDNRISMTEQGNILMTEQGNILSFGPDWKSWEKHTKRDPSFITTVNWPSWGILDDLLIKFRAINIIIEERESR